MEAKIKQCAYQRICDSFAITSIVMLAIVYQQYYKQHKDELFTHQRILNNTIVSDQSYLVFNRVPKAGSEMLWTLIDILSVENNFTSYSDSMKAKNDRGAENTYLRTAEARKYYVDMWRPKTNESVKDINNLNNMKSGKENIKEELLIYL